MLIDADAQAREAVRTLESAGVPSKDISLVANNSDGWFNSDKKLDRDRDGVDDRADKTIATLTFSGLAKTSRFDQGEQTSRIIERPA